MAKFPVDAPIADVLKAFECLCFRILRSGNHIAMIRQMELTISNEKMVLPQKQSQSRGNCNELYTIDRF